MNVGPDVVSVGLETFHSHLPHHLLSLLTHPQLSSLKHNQLSASWSVVATS